MRLKRHVLHPLTSEEKAPWKLFNNQLRGTIGFLGGGGRLIPSDVSEWRSSGFRRGIKSWLSIYHRLNSISRSRSRRRVEHWNLFLLTLAVLLMAFNFTMINWATTSIYYPVRAFQPRPSSVIVSHTPSGWRSASNLIIVGGIGCLSLEFWGLNLI